MFKESSIRSVVKALVWRFIATLTTTILVFVFTDQLDLAITVGIGDALVKMVLYFAHERVWNRLEFGRQLVAPDLSKLEKIES